MLHHVAAHVVADAIGVPGRPRQQVLHPARRDIADVLGQRPAVLARQPSQQANNKRPRPPPRLHPAETGPNPQHQLIEHAQPPARIYAMASGHRQIVMCRHKP
jgi:hypothetical protein